MTDMISTQIFDHVDSLLREIAHDVIVPHYKNLRSQDIQQKAEGEIVTAADFEVERLLAEKLPKILTGTHVIGEEMVACDPDLLSIISERRPVWVVDPIDGTRNFYNGTGRFASIVSLVQDGKPMAGWIFDVANDIMAHTALGQGVTINGKAHNIAPHHNTPQDMSGFLFPPAFSEEVRGDVEINAEQFKSTRSLHCIACEYLDFLMESSIDFCAFPRSRLWDHIAGCLMVNEAGGLCQTVTERPVADDILYHRKQWIVAAKSPEAWENVRKTLFQGIDWHSYCI